MTNEIYYGDNLDVLRKFIEPESIDLCYIDPPFNSKRNYNQIYNNIGGEDKALARAFVDTWTWDDMAIQGLSEIQSNYHGRFTEQSIDLITGLEKVLKRGSLFAYLVSMTLRITEIYRALKPTGSFYLHCDPTASHYLKLVIDSVFCPRGGDFRNEVIWWYETGGIPRADFARKHDIIFRYTKSKKWTFNASEILESRSDEVLRRIATGNASATRSTGELRHPSDVLKIASINAMAKERLGYPTQKPEALLERIIRASSNEGDVVLDAYCGCGTTVAVAEKLKRHWIGIDITYQSISLILKRLEDNFGRDFTPEIVDEDTKQIITPTVKINGVPKDFSSAKALAEKNDDRTRKEFEKWLILTYSRNRAIINEKKGGDKGIDGIAYVPDRNEKGETENKKVLISVKSSKTLTPSMINELNGVVDRDNAACGIFLSLYPAQNLVKASKEFGYYRNNLVNKDYPKIQVVCVEDVFNGNFLELPNIDINDWLLKQAEQHVGEQTTIL